MTWKHQPTYSVVKGTVRVYCVCGWFSKSGDQTSAEASYREHTGLKEVKRK